MPPRGWHPTPEMIAKRRATIQARSRPFEEVFWSKVRKTEGCWEWAAGRIPGGYGMTHINRKPVAAHRVAWQLTHGPIPDGLFVCHSCDNPPCVRPDHLEPVTQDENMRRSEPAQRTHCKWGHAFTPENTIIRKRGGGRDCRECNRRAVRRYIARKRDEQWVA